MKNLTEGVEILANISLTYKFIAAYTPFVKSNALSNQTQSFPKVGAGNKRFEHFNLTKALDETDLESVINAIVEQFPDYGRAAKK